MTGTSSVPEHPVKRVLSPNQNPWLALLFLVVFQTFSGDLRTAIAARLGNEVTTVLWYGLGGLIVIIVLIQWAMERRAYRATMAVVAENERLRALRPGLGEVVPSPPRQGLIVPVSPGVYEHIAAYCAIRHHYEGTAAAPDGRRFYLWLIHTPEPEEEPKPPSQSSFKNARDLARHYRGLDCEVELLTVNNLHDPREALYKVDQAYRQSAELYRLPASAIVADITGGTKLMSIGIAFAGAHEERDLQLTESTGPQTADGRPIPDATCAHSRYRLIDVRSIRDPAAPQMP